MKKEIHGSRIMQLIKSLKELIPYAYNEAGGLADVDEDKLAEQAWKKIKKAEDLLENIGYPSASRLQERRLEKLT